MKLENKIHLKKYLCLSFLVLFLFMVSGNFFFFYQYRTYTKNYNHKLGMVISLVKEKYPKVKEEDLIAILNSKDMPIEDNYRLPIMAYSKRENPFDALVLPKGESEIHGAIGCASSRRAVQLKKLYPDIEVRPVRGNVLTRLNKLDSGEYGALVLACAGLERLGMSDRISRVFNEDEMLPAAGQGIIAVQGRAGEDFSYLEGVDCYESRLCAIAERAFIRELDGGCSSPVAAFAKIQNEVLVLKGMNVKNDEPLFGSICGSFEEAEKIGKILAGRLK